MLHRLSHSINLNQAGGGRRVQAEAEAKGAGAEAGERNREREREKEGKRKSRPHSHTHSSSNRRVSLSPSLLSACRLKLTSLMLSSVPDGWNNLLPLYFYPLPCCITTSVALSLFPARATAQAHSHLIDSALSPRIRKQMAGQMLSRSGRTTTTTTPSQQQWTLLQTRKGHYFTYARDMRQAHSDTYTHCHLPVKALRGIGGSFFSFSSLGHIGDN